MPYDNPDLFTIAKRLAKSVYLDNRPQSLEDYQSLLEEAIAEACEGRGRQGIQDSAIINQAQRSASWWWKNVFHKDEEPCADRESPEEAATRAKALIRLMRNMGALILDTETTGLGAQDRIIELSVIDMRGRVLFSSLINPGFQIGARIEELTGISDRMLWGKPRFRDVVHEVADLFRGQTLTAWNSSFDIRMLKNEFSLAGVEFEYENQYDAMPLFAKAMGMDTKFVKLVAAKRMMGLGDSQEHRSLADCMDTLAVLQAVLDERRPVDEQPELF